MQGPLEATARSREDALSALDEATRWLLPASRADLVRTLGELYLHTVRRAEQSEDRKGLIALYTRELMAFPGDLALSAIRDYRGTFFPALEDLRRPIEQSSKLIARRNVVRALREFLESDEEPDRELSPEERAKVRASFSKLAEELRGRSGTHASDGETS